MKKLKSNIYLLSLFGALLTCSGASEDPFFDLSHSDIPRTWQSPVTGLKYFLVFNDEFEGKKVDERRWGFRKDDFSAETRTIEHEQQKITIRVEDKASSIKNGNLELSVYRKNADSRAIFTGGIHTKHKFRPRYGYFETKVYLKDAADSWGHWPSFWIYFSPEDKNTTGTEVDIFEYIPNEKKVHQTIHWYTNNIHNSKSYSFVINPDIPHVMALEWTKEELIFYFDGKVTQRLKKSDNPKYVPSSFQMLFYSMSAGTWGGNVADKKNPLPAVSRFAYCRAYQTEKQSALYSFDDKPMVEISAKDRIAETISDVESSTKKEVEWELSWSDDFAGKELDETKWALCQRGKNPWNDTVSDDPRLLKIKDGVVHLRGIVNDKQDKDSPPYLTAGITSKGRFSFLYGKVQIRARFKSAQGAWPALWMMGNEWKSTYGEIDLMEHLNFDQKVHQTVHSEYTMKVDTTNTPAKGSTAIIKRDDWNTYGCEWDADKIVFTVNGKPSHTYPRLPEKGEKQWPFNQPFFFILSMQIGGEWVNGSGPTDPSHYPAGMEIDWVRVYSRKKPSNKPDTSDVK